MPSEDVAELSSIDQALAECSEYIERNRASSRTILMVILQLGLLALMGGAFLVVSRIFNDQAKSSIGSIAVYGLLVLTSVLIAVLVSLYKFHLSEIARTEHYKIGFLRIRIAANNFEGGFTGEVRKSLTEGAFSYESTKPQKGGKIESPIPGHPTSDLATLVLNKAFEGIEVTLKPKSKGGTASEA